MNVPVGRREVARRLVGEALARVGDDSARTRPAAARRASPCRARAVEEDPAADVGVDQALAPARRVLARPLGSGAEPLLQEAELAAAQRRASRPSPTTATASVRAAAPSRRSRGARARARARRRDEVEAEQARERGAERSTPSDAGDDADHRDRTRLPRRANDSARARRRAPASRAPPRSCSPEERRLAAAARRRRTRPRPRRRRRRVDDDQLRERVPERSRVSRNAAAPRVSAASSASLPAATSASAPFGSAEATIRSANAATPRAARRRGQRRAARGGGVTASTAVASERDVRGADRDVGSAGADVDAREVARAQAGTGRR